MKKEQKSITQVILFYIFFLSSSHFRSLPLYLSFSLSLSHFCCALPIFLSHGDQKVWSSQVQFSSLCCSVYDASRHHNHSNLQEEKLKPIVKIHFSIFKLIKLSQSLISQKILEKIVFWKRKRNCTSPSCQHLIVPSVINGQKHSIPKLVVTIILFHHN